MKKLVILSAIVMAGMLAACSPSGGSDESSESSDSTSEVATSDEVSADGTVDYDLWTIWPDDTTGEGQIVKDFVDKYVEENPNVNITINPAEAESYKDKLKVVFSADELPDIFFTYGAGYTEPFVESGKVLDITDIIDPEVEDKLLEGTTTNFTYDDKLYGLPVKMWAGVMYVNREIFDEVGLEYPETWDELLNAVEVFRENGYQPMCMGGKDAWNPGLYIDILNVREATIDGVDQTFAGEKPFTDPEYVEAATKFQTLVNMDAFNDGFIAQGAQETLAEFLMGKMPMAFNGSWLAGDMQSDLNQVKDKIDVIPFPTTNEANGNMEFTGGAIDGYAITTSAEQPEIAVDVLEKLTQYQSEQGYLTGGGISVYETDISEEDLNPVLAQITELLMDAEGYTLASDTKFSGQDIDTFLTNVQDLQANKVTPEEYTQVLEDNITFE